MAISKTVLAKRPPNVLKNFGDRNVALINGKAIYDMARKERFIVGAFNIRHMLSVEGIARAAHDTDSPVIFEIAKSEADYCDQPPEIFAKDIVDICEKVGCEAPIAIHADHTTVKSLDPKEFDSSRDLIERAIANGYTTISIDASHNPNEDNLRITAELGKIVMASGLGLEVEIGEIGGEGGFSTPEEAEWFIYNLDKRGVKPDMLALNNGSVHGNYSKGASEGIQLELTKQIYETVKKWGVGIAQHGITGTPLSKIAKFADYGIFKGNVATLWQNIYFGLKMDESSNVVYDENGDYIKLDDEGIPTELWHEVLAWAEETGNGGGNLKKCNKPFKEKFWNVAPEYRERIDKTTYKWAKDLYVALRSAGAGKQVFDHIANS